MDRKSQQVENVAKVEADGHDLEHVESERYRCAACEWEGSITADRTATMLEGECAGSPLPGILLA